MLQCTAGRYLALLTVTAGVCLSQQTGQPPSPGTSTPVGGGNTTSPGTNRPGSTTGTTLPGTTQDSRNPFPTEMPRPFFLSGKVILSDGTPPPESVMIERVCGARIIHEGYTNGKGNFSIELGRNQGMFMDASTDNLADPFNARGASTRTPGMGSVTERSLMGCELRASLAGFRSSVVNLSSRRSLDNPDVGTIVLKRLANVEGLTISATSMSAPKDARKAYDKGRELLQKGKLDDSAKQLDKALELYPRYAVAWYERGRVYEAKNEIEEAKKAYGEALKVDSKLITPYERLAGIAVQSRAWQDAADITERMIRLNPVDFPQAYLFNSIANLNMQKLDAAEKSASDLIKMDPQHRPLKIEHVMGVIQAQKQNWEGAAAHLHAFVDQARPGVDVETARKQLAEVEKTLAAQKQN